MEQIEFNLLFRWFVGLGMDDPVWDASTFCHNRDRLLEADISALVLNGVIEHRKVRGLLSRDHFSVDGTLIEAWASMKSFRPKGGGAGRNAERDFHGEKRSNEAHESTTDADARLYRKGNGRESRLCFMGHALMENRNGLVVGGNVTIASGTAEREAALELIDRHCPGKRRRTLGADKAYDVTALMICGAARSRPMWRCRIISPRPASGARPGSTAAPRSAVSQRIRKRIRWLTAEGMP